MPCNIVLITADDMNYDSPGCAGCSLPDITPNIDRLAREGVRFTHAHVTISVCQPSRQALMTGLYPHRNGGMGFDPIEERISTLQERLHEAGFLNGILGKVQHLEPEHKFCWDMAFDMMDLGYGRDPRLFRRYARDFFQKARTEGKPFFLMANSHDPHRPFAGSQDELREDYKWEKNWDGTWRKRFGAPPQASCHYGREEVAVPGFLPDLPDVQREVAQYFGSVHRCDETVGEILAALQDFGFEENTLVMFLSDNGMAFPFAKTNCYLASTRTPWIVRWPARIKAGQVDTSHLIAGVDFMPTVLEAVGLKPADETDGRSFLNICMGDQDPNRNEVFTFFNTTYAGNAYPIRCVQNRRFGYIFNGWSDGVTIFKNESQSGLTFKAMQEAAKTDLRIAERVHFFQYRVPDELYDFEKDPCALNNLLGNPVYKGEIREMRERLLNIMTATGDPALEQFKARMAL